MQYNDQVLKNHGHASLYIHSVVSWLFSDKTKNMTGRAMHLTGGQEMP